MEHQYHQLLEDILKYGEKTEDRTGVGTISIFGYQMRFNLQDGFPAVTTKRLAWKSCVAELIWFLEGSTDERRLAELTYGRDRELLVGKRTIWTDNADAQGKALGYVNNDYEKQLGPVYGYSWSKLESVSGKIVQVEKRVITEEEDFFYKPPLEVAEEAFNDDFIGKTLTSNKGRDFTVICKRSTGSNSKYKVQFQDTHDIIWASRPNLKLRQVGKGMICGIAVNDCDEGIHRTDIGKRIYTLWYNMIRRCYDENLPKYEYYGGNGIRVCKRWHRLSNFIRDIEQIPNYYSWVRNPTDYCLDKDYYDSDGYSPSTCVFLRSGDNVSLQNNSINFNSVKKCKFPDGRVIEFLFNKDLRNLYSDYNFTDEGIRVAILTGGKHRGCNFSKIDASPKKAFRKELLHNQISWLINEIRTNPNSRRLILTAWNPLTIDSMALPPCHLLCQFYVRNNKLSCQLYQRSADSMLGIPFNIASYSLLTHIIARECNLEVGDFVHTIGDAHIYLNHIDQVKEQLSRDPYDLPTLYIDEDFSLRPLLENSRYKFPLDTVDKFKLINYNSHDTIKAPMAV